MNYDDWLEQPYQEQAAKDEAIDQEVESLLSGEFDPLNIDNFLWACDDAALYAFKEQIEAGLTDPTPNFETLGRAVFDAVYAHWRNKAESDAAERYNKGLIGDDYDPD